MHWGKSFKKIRAFRLIERHPPVSWIGPCGVVNGGRPAACVCASIDRSVPVGRLRVGFPNPQFESTILSDSSANAPPPPPPRRNPRCPHGGLVLAVVRGGRGDYGCWDISKPGPIPPTTDRHNTFRPTPQTPPHRALVAVWGLRSLGRWRRLADRFARSERAELRTRCRAERRVRWSRSSRPPARPAARRPTPAGAW